jgi:hypothetical protein
MGSDGRYWGAYVCNRCGGLVVAASDYSQGHINELYPTADNVDEAIPEKSRNFLSQAMNSLHAPAGAVMLAASSVDSMLKEKGYKTGKLYDRINKAAEEHLITADMAKWAHQVRLDANDQRHADEEADLPTTSEAQQTINFARALGEFLFVLPSQVTHGLTETKPVKQ